jgi:Spy/CpxP family protein refolding chaperone
VKATLFLFALGELAVAQAPRGLYPWWDMQIVRNLDLSEDQQGKVRATVREYRDRLVDLRAAVEKSENDLKDVFDDANPDSRRAEQSIEKLVAARAELTRAFSQLHWRLRTILDARQWEELQKRVQPPPPPPAPAAPGPKRHRAPAPAPPSPPPPPPPEVF